MKRRRLLLGALGFLAVAAGLAAWKPLAAFNLLVPKDGGAELAKADVAYGPLPRQRLDIYRPAHAAKTLPVILFLYGGAWDSGSRQDYAFAGQALASRGYLVVIPDYRLVPEVRFPDFLRDCALAMHWTRANAAKFGGDGDRVVLAGHSAGAYNAAMLVLDPRWLGGDRTAVRGLVTLAGPFDFLPLDDPASIAAFSHWPRLQETQPVHFANPNAPPVLLLHGAGDIRVRPRNSLRLKAELDRVGAKADLRLYPGVSHAGILLALSRPLRGGAPTLDDIDRFARQVTQ
ncbi:alpha/beta hydrolase [Novosphingobium sp. EMRT-2]|uniref:alpha/beta hydrolase n=1 Tax=Novosphingobium sp. EMRT-2 TaxID=2571749 RepID=UPI0010BDECC4|nr:alpha/beta hydrolase [Novosphingobium sp. EMRT-2]MCH2219410.1 alpha/beta hydrolase [Dechloromonas sp.]QCI92382.1 alpha/beta hydrolase [Novosphingobium sp. EMRT-2]